MAMAAPVVISDIPEKGAVLDPTVHNELPMAGSPRVRIKHMRYAASLGLPTFQLGTPQTGPIAIVGLGPSLNDTWEEIAKFDHILTVSGAHQFLIQRGIVPTWHSELDTRPHKIEAMGLPHKDVHYLIGATVHPKMWDHLKGYHVTLFYPLSSNPVIIRDIPRGEWCVSAGGSVGNKAVVIARMLGFTDMRLFGFDSCIRNGIAHAIAHPNPVRPEYIQPCVVNGRTFLTTKPLLSYAQIALRLTDRLSDTKFTFYGDGLLQEMYKTHVRTEDPILFASKKGILITPAYRDLLRQFHAQRPTFGTGASDANRDRLAQTVKDLMKALDAKTVLDYGCGKGTLADDLDFPIWEYDPAIPGKDRDARPAEIVICVDTLEHVEPECLPDVLRDLQRVTQKLVYFEIRLTQAKRVLPDGRNAHLIQQSEDWWLEQLDKHFVLIRAFKIESDEPSDEGSVADLFVWAGAFNDEKYNTIPGGRLSVSLTPLEL